MYVPKHFHFAISTGISLLGFYIKHKLGDTYDVVIVFLVMQYHAIMHTAYIFVAGRAYQNYITQAPPKVEPITNWHTGAEVAPIPPPSDGFIPLGRKPADTVPVYNQVVSLPRYDYERNFAHTIITMRNCNMKVDMTEEYWIKGKRYGESREKFLEMFDKWEYHGLSDREGKQSKRVAKDWRKIRLVEQGNPLPPPPR